MNKRVDPSVLQTGYLHYINKKLADMLDILSRQVPKGRVAKFNINVSGRKVIYMDELIGDNAISVSIKNAGGSKLYVGVNAISADLELDPGEVIPISFNGRYIRMIVLESNDTIAEVVTSW